MNEVTQTGFAMGAIGLAGTVAGLFFGWLKDRDRLNNGTEITEIKAQNTVQAGQIAANALASAQLARQLSACERKHDECEEKHQVAAERQATTDARIEEIMRLIAAKKDKTGPRSPLTE